MLEPHCSMKILKPEVVGWSGDYAIQQKADYADRR